MTSFSVGNATVSFFHTVLPFTAMSKLPDGPGLSCVSNCNSFLRAAAARAARGL